MAREAYITGVELHLIDRAADDIGRQVNPRHPVEPDPGDDIGHLQAFHPGLVVHREGIDRAGPRDRRRRNIF